jgi:cell division protein FtsL
MTTRLHEAPTTQRPARPVKRARIVRPETPRVNNAVLFTIIVLTIGTIGLLYVIQTSQVAGLGYEVSRLERERTEKSLENQQLTYQVANYQALPRVQEVAIDDLGMQPMSDYIFITVPLPPHDDPPMPGPEPSNERSVIGRIWDRITGVGSASNPGAGR